MKSNLRIVRGKIKKAANKIKKNPKDINLVAVSKTFSVNHILAAYRAGQYIFGENKIQEALDKLELLKDYKGISFHFIGHIQSNKAKFLPKNFDLIQSVDRQKIAEIINKKAKEYGITQSILIQVNLTKEKQKSGVYPSDLDSLIEAINKLNNLNIEGFMYIPPLKINPEDNRENFRGMAELFLQYKKPLGLKYLSMGMSQDFEVAIEEGSNMVRIGTAIFGERNYQTN
ncbi:MAG: YggS family pyridoxal phosphate-dependent enzyme [Deferribacterota bacterium]|nr:YggS family pyridoxal phosphate-dependent enzyme [Deferribacterota bacterium]